MPKLVWDKLGEKFYETGVDHGVFYGVGSTGAYEAGEVWNGLTAVNETPSGAEPSSVYADNIKYLTITSAEEYGITIEAYYYPPKFAECDGTAAIADGVYIGQQARKSFGFSYRTRMGNDVANDQYGYKLHLVYGCLASPSERSYATVNDNPEPISFSWDVKCTPVTVTGFQPTACITIDSTKVDKQKLAALEAILYGSETEEARLPLPDEVAEIFAAA